jgi:hypothetical protein
VLAAALSKNFDRVEARQKNRGATGNVYNSENVEAEA